MTVINVPISKGLATESIEYDWIDSLPINLLAVKKEVLGSSGYLTSWPGLELIPAPNSFTPDGTPLDAFGSRGAIFNAIIPAQYRGMRNFIYKITRALSGEENVIEEIALGNLTNTLDYLIVFSHSRNSLAFIDRIQNDSPLTFLTNDNKQPRPIFIDGKGDQPALPKMKDWSLNEYNPTKNTPTWIPNLTSTQDDVVQTYITIQSVSTFTLSGGNSPTTTTNCTLTLDIKFPSLVAVESDKYWILSSNDEPVITRLGVYISGSKVHAGQLAIFYKVVPVQLSSPFAGTVEVPVQEDVVVVDDISPSLRYTALTFELTSNTLVRMSSVSRGTPFGGDKYFIFSLAIVQSSRASGVILDFGYEFNISSASPPTSAIIYPSRGTANPAVISSNSEFGPWVKTNISTLAYSPPTSFSGREEGTFTNVLDVTHNIGRYIFIQDDKNNFVITDLTNEQRPDYLSPIYDASSQYGGNVTACRIWKDLVVIFNKHVIQYFQLTGNTEQIYQKNKSLTVQCGALSKYGVAEFLDSFVVLGSPFNEPVGVYFITQGTYKELSDRRIQKYLRRYKVEQLTYVLIEPYKFDEHDGFIVHLPDITLCYDSHYQESPWRILSSSIDGTGRYVAQNIIYDDNLVSWYGGNIVGFNVLKLNPKLATHNGNPVLYQCTTPLLQLRNVTIHDIDINNVNNPKDLNDETPYDFITIEKTQDGQTYFDNTEVRLNNINMDIRTLLRNYGYVKNNIGFRLSWTNPKPISISHFRLRVEQ